MFVYLCLLRMWSSRLRVVCGPFSTFPTLLGHKYQLIFKASNQPQSISRDECGLHSHAQVHTHTHNHASFIYIVSTVCFAVIVCNCSAAGLYIRTLIALHIIPIIAKETWTIHNEQVLPCLGNCVRVLPSATLTFQITEIDFQLHY